VKFFLYVLPAVVALVWLVRALRGTIQQSRSSSQSWLAWLAGCLVIIGGGCFFGNALAAMGIMPVEPNFEWPAGTVDGVVQGADGIYAVPIEAAGRVQLYDESRKFIRGMQVDGEGGSLKLWLSSPGNVEIYTARGRKHFTYSYEGTLLHSNTYTDEFIDLPGGDKQTMPVVWWGWPLSSPFHGWLLALAGGILLWLDKRMTRAIAVP
jgi:hypothetical protein